MLGFPRPTARELARFASWKDKSRRLLTWICLRRSTARSLSFLCPHCGRMAYRSRRIGWRDSFAMALGWYPYRCYVCQHRFHLARRSQL